MENKTIWWIGLGILCYAPLAWNGWNLDFKSGQFILKYKINGIKDFFHI